MGNHYKVGQTCGVFHIDEKHAAGGGKSYMYYVFHCVVCGHVFSGGGGYITNMNRDGCAECNRIKRAGNRQKKYSEYVGHRFGALEIVKLRGTEKVGKKSQAFFVECRCLKCGSIKKYRLDKVIHKEVAQCAACSVADAFKCSQSYHKAACFDGTKPPMLNFRRNGLANKNNTSGCNGVSRTKQGNWRAYISLKGKTYHLGVFSNFDDAVAARKTAEKQLYDPEIQAFVDAKPEWKNIIDTNIKANKERPR